MVRFYLLCFHSAVEKVKTKVNVFVLGSLVCLRFSFGASRYFQSDFGDMHVHTVSVLRGLNMTESSHQKPKQTPAELEESGGL